MSSIYPTHTLVAAPQAGGGYTYTQVDATQYATGLRSLIAGPSLEVHLNPRFSVELNAMHKLLRANSWLVFEDGTRSKTYTSTGAAIWQFPVLMKYRLRWRKVAPFVEAGPSLRLPQGDLATHGLTGGAGIGMHLRALKVAPAVRFTHWGPHAGIGSSGAARNEAAVLVGLSFGGGRLQ